LLWFEGTQPCETPEADDWLDSFSHLFKHKLDVERTCNEPWAPYDLAAQRILSHVVPRLLAPSHLTSPDGGRLEPTYIHGDMHDFNLGLRRDGTNQPILIDVNGYYAHNEMELACWWSHFTDVMRGGVALYAELGGEIAQPEAEFEDRVRLYSLTKMLNYMAGQPGSSMRQS